MISFYRISLWFSFICYKEFGLGIRYCFFWTIWFKRVRTFKLFTRCKDVRIFFRWIWILMFSSSFWISLILLKGCFCIIFFIISFSCLSFIIVNFCVASFNLREVRWRLRVLIEILSNFVISIYLKENFFKYVICSRVMM